jgi:hypothetical protein
MLNTSSFAAVSLCCQNANIKVSDVCRAQSKHLESICFSGVHLSTLVVVVDANDKI